MIFSDIHLPFRQSNTAMEHPQSSSMLFPIQTSMNFQTLARSAMRQPRLWNEVTKVVQHFLWRKKLGAWKVATAGRVKRFFGLLVDHHESRLTL